MVWRWLSFAFGLAGIAAIGVVVFLYVQPSSSGGPRLHVEQAERVMDNVVVGREYDLDFRVVNDGDQAARVIGAEYS